MTLIISCSLGFGAEMINNSYPNLYKVEGNHENLYKDLVKIEINDEIDEIVNEAKKTAKMYGYPISGNNLDVYLFEGKEYPIEITVYENSEYYLIILMPLETPISDQHLEISIHKQTKEIITILPGS